MICSNLSSDDCRTVAMNLLIKNQWFLTVVDTCRYITDVPGIRQWIYQMVCNRTFCGDWRQPLSFIRDIAGPNLAPNVTDIFMPLLGFEQGSLTQKYSTGFCIFYPTLYQSSQRVNPLARASRNVTTITLLHAITLINFLRSL